MSEGDEVNLEKGNDFSSIIDMYKNLKQNSKKKLNVPTCQRMLCLYSIFFKMVQNSKPPQKITGTDHEVNGQFYSSLSYCIESPEKKIQSPTFSLSV